MTSSAPLGVRERKKLDTRKALSDAALELMFEVGLENVVREDIADRAGVSLRTFSNYFANKYDALAYRVAYRIRLSATLLLTRPAEEPLWSAIAEAIIDPLRADGAPFGRPNAAQLIEVSKLNGSPHMQAALARITTDELVDAIAQRTGTDAGKDLYPQLVANVTLAAMNAVLNHYPLTDPSITVPAALRAVFANVAEGLPPIDLERN